MTTPLIIIRDIRARHFPRFYCRRDFRQIRLTVRRQRCNFAGLFWVLIAVPLVQLRYRGAGTCANTSPKLS